MNGRAKSAVLDRRFPGRIENAVAVDEQGRTFPLDDEAARLAAAVALCWRCFHRVDPMKVYNVRAIR